MQSALRFPCFRLTPPPLHLDLQKRARSLRSVCEELLEKLRATLVDPASMVLILVEWRRKCLWPARLLCDPWAERSMGGNSERFRGSRSHPRRKKGRCGGHIVYP